MTDCALPCFMFTCVPSGNVKLIPDIGSAASAKPSAPSAITGRNIEPVVSEDGSSRSYLALFWDSRICLFASPTLNPRACIHLVMPRWYTWISLRKEVRRTFESWLSRTRYFFHAHSYRSSAVILLKILIWRQRYNDKRTCTRLHRGYAYRHLRLFSSFFPLSLAISLRSTFARSLAIWKKVAIVIPPLFPFMQLSYSRLHSRVS